jgi:hypothetical protein
VRVYRGSDIGSDHFLTLYDTDFHQKGYIYPTKTARQENIPHYKIILLKDGSIRWLYEQIKKWDDELRLIVQQKNLTYKKYCKNKTIDNDIE